MLNSYWSRAVRFLNFTKKNRMGVESEAGNVPENIPSGFGAEGEGKLIDWKEVKRIGWVLVRPNDIII